MALIHENLQRMARADASFGPTFLVKDFMNPKQRPPWVPGIRISRMIKGVKKETPHPDFEPSGQIPSTALLKYKTDHAHDKTTSALSKMTTRSKVVEFQAPTSGEVHIQVLLATWWHRTYDSVSHTASRHKDDD